MTRLKALFTHNWWLKLIALVSSIMLFSYVRGAEDAQRSIFMNVSVTLPSDATETMLISQPPDRVRLTLRGSRSRINAIRPESLPPVAINLTDPDQRYYYFADDDFDLPTGVTITQVAPTSIPLEWARRTRRELPIQARLTGTLAEGLIISEPAQADPNVVELVGAAPRIERLSVVMTEPLDLGSLDVGRHVVHLPLQRPPDHVRYAGTNATDVVVVVEQGRSERVFPEVPLTSSGALGTETTSVTVHVEGPTGLLDSMSRDSLAATVDLTRLDEAGTAAVSVSGLPTGVTLARTEPERVALTPSH